MPDHLSHFIKDTTKENFLKVQQLVVSDPEYDPYSDDLEILENLLNDEQFEKVVAYQSINILLSPKAHLFKNYALDELGKTEAAESELIIARKLIEGLSLTGSGAQSDPYLVTRISDEPDMMEYLEEEMESQNLINTNGKYFDLLKCRSGCEIYFDITIPYLRMKYLFDK